MNCNRQIRLLCLLRTGPSFPLSAKLNFEETVLAIEVFSRCALLLTVFEALHVDDVAELLHVDREMVRYGREAALWELTNRLGSTASAFRCSLSAPENRRYYAERALDVTRKSDPATSPGGLPLLFPLLDLRRVTLQRLFSTFANGLPGKGLVLLRLAVSAFLIYDAAKSLSALEDGSHTILKVGAAAVGILLFAGLWTPIAGVLVSCLPDLDLRCSQRIPWRAHPSRCHRVRSFAYRPGSVVR